MKTIDYVRVALLLLAIALLTRGIDRLRYPKYELVANGNTRIAVADRGGPLPGVKKSLSAAAFGWLQVSIGVVLIGGLGWTFWQWDRWRLRGSRPPAVRSDSSVRGFTLIELLVVIGIISILASMLLPTLGRSKGKAHMAQCLNNMRQIGFAAVMYVQDHLDTFPSDHVFDSNGVAWTFWGIGGGATGLQGSGWVPRAEARPLFSYVKPSEVYRCTEDNGAIYMKPTCWAVGGCSYNYNYSVGGIGWVGDTKFPADGFLPDNKESWVSNPSKFILFTEFPAMRITLVPPGVGLYCHWHERKRSEEFLYKDLPSDPSRFISPVTFVDGHVARHDFTDSIKNGPYIYEETKDWIWYKPKLPDVTGP
jgi:prepilin-type N-terminal cleavage/methylation domain-containing protein